MGWGLLEGECLTGGFRPIEVTHDRLLPEGALGKVAP